MNWKRIVIIFFLFLVLLIVVFYRVLRTNVAMSNLFTLIGTYVSIFALVLTLIQIRHLDNTAHQVKEAAENAKQAVEKVVDISSIANYISYLRFVKESLTNGKYELARMRLHDVKDFMPRIKHISGIDYNDNELRSVTSNVEEILSSLDDQVNNVNSIDISSITRNIESVTSFLNRIENQLKA